MQTFALPSGLKLGTDIVDRQHAQFFDLMNGLIEADATHVDPVQINGIIADLADYVQTHFRTEEELMERCGFPHLEEHQLMHAKFAARVEDFHRKFARGEIGIEHEILAYMVEWFTDHIRTEDARYADAFRAAGY
ncbi:hemerythrin family protein [bacterium]|nr:hemerythrin family protein [bacterium]